VAGEVRDRGNLKGFRAWGASVRDEFLVLVLWPMRYTIGCTCFQGAMPLTLACVRTGHAEDRDPVLRAQAKPAECRWRQRLELVVKSHLKPRYGVGGDKQIF